MADEPLCFYCNEPRVAMGCWSEDHTGIGLCGGHEKELGATFHHMEPTPESLEEIPEIDLTHRRLFRNLAEGWRKAHDDLGLPMGLLAAANPYWQESVQQWKKLHAHTSRDTLFRRALYGGRKGRSAARRLGEDGRYAWNLGREYGARRHSLYAAPLDRERVQRLVAHYLRRTS